MTSAGQLPLNRREALRLLAAGITSGLAACSKPEQEIVPYVRMPEELVPGVPMKFATTLPLSGFGRGVIVTSVDGRPIKVEGNPRHPASQGATDVFAEASVLSLYDPDRSRTVLNNGEIASWEGFRAALLQQRGLWQQNGGAGLRLLTGRVTSPTLLRQIDDLLKAFPRAAWHAYDPLDDAALAGAQLAYGRPLQAVPHLDRARIILSLDADPIGPGPDQIRNGRGFGSRRVPDSQGFSRLYALEAAPTLTGAKADHRLSLPPHVIAEAAVAVASALGAGLRQPRLPPEAARLVDHAIADLNGNRAAALVLAGPTQPAETHALVHWINSRIAAPVDLVDPIGRVPGTLADLVHELEGGSVQALFIAGANPAYDAPADLAFGEAIRKVPFRLHLGSYVDETARLATWHIPQSHPLEAWSDLRAVDGTASLVQPLVRPLFGTWTDHEVLATLLGATGPSAYDLVRETWRPQGGADFEAWWRQALERGTIADSAAKPAANPGEPRLPEIGPARDLDPGAITIVLRPDPTLWDGHYANNAWLQECPKPLTKQVWGNALTISPEQSDRLGVAEGHMVRVSAGTRQVEVPVLVEPGLPAGIASLTLGLGRTSAGAIGSGLGSNGYQLRSSASPWLVENAAITRMDGHQPILRPQNVVRTHEEVEDRYPLKMLSELGHGHAPETSDTIPSLLPGRPLPDDGHAWAMVIDTSLCIGCNACVIACQAENNVPVVGPEEIERGRQMHWLRVDVYDCGTAENPNPGFQPVPCMHCEHAPCEPVCPVEASVHTGEGLNMQVYNRCVGTRFCQANCPYKVRRFNFFGYADGQEYANLGFQTYQGQKNPDVTVRARGVMEKCTYCVQRISGARRAAERENRPIGPDEVTTACQDACPTRAITFGDLHQESATVNRLKGEERHYALLGHLGTRPRTTYLADIRNPAPGLDEDHA